MKKIDLNLIKSEEDKKLCEEQMENLIKLENIKMKQKQIG